MESIKGKVAVIGVGCTKFGELWDKGHEDLMVEASYLAMNDAGVELEDIQAAWVGANESALSGAALGNALKLQDIPITRCQNFCATGSDAFRNACFSVAAGLYDIVLVVGFEKPKDSGLQGRGAPYATVLEAGGTGPGMFGLACMRYFVKYGAGREHLAKIAVKNHHNGTLTPRSMFRNEITVEQALNAPMIAWPLGVFDCCGVADGGSAVVITRRDMAKSFRDDYVVVLGTGLAATPGQYWWQPRYDFLSWSVTEHAANEAYRMAGISNPAREIHMAQVHDCFTMTELVTYEDLRLCPKGEAKDYIDSGAFTLEGHLPVNTDGGLKAFGHPAGATGVRQIYENCTQLQRRLDGPRQVKNATVGLSHNVGGNVSVNACVNILGLP